MIQQGHVVLPHGAALVRLAPASRSCFVAGTAILMADGRTRPIEAVRPGDHVIGRRGRPNRVMASLRARLGQRRLYGLNDGQPFVTVDHPFLTTEGWKALDPVATRSRHPGLQLEALQLGDRLCRGTMFSPSLWHGRVPVTEGLLFVQGTAELVSIEAVDADPGTHLFDLVLDGDHGYVADGWIVCGRGGEEEAIRSGRDRP
ncbi:Hint domain-containing homing endonuclease [Benzoatithermus flavus]|uniref:Hint domain-containing homing endonuclease n=1 Tax=Benzoatithermus flavus TaxID=3108223 RepID=A0ABU8XSP5_9PROT